MNLIAGELYFVYLSFGEYEAGSGVRSLERLSLIGVLGLNLIDGTFGLVISSETM